MPVYSEFGLNYEKFKPTMINLLTARAWQAAAYCSASVYFNDKKIPITSFKDFCQMFTGNEVLHLTMQQPNNKHN